MGKLNRKVAGVLPVVQVQAAVLDSLLSKGSASAYARYLSSALAGATITAGDGRRFVSDATATANGTRLLQVCDISSASYRSAFTRQAERQASNVNAGVTVLAFGSTVPSEVTVTGGANGSYIGSGGLLAFGSAPRVDYLDGTAALLIEPAATNLCLQSNAMTTSPWTNAVSGLTAPSVTANFSTSPTGATNATRVVLPASGAAEQYSALQQLVAGLTPGVTYVVSVYAKGSGNTYLGVQLGQAPYTWLGNQKITTDGTWRRYSVVFTAGSSSAYVGFGPNLTGSVQGSSSGGSFDLYGWQIEVGTTPTSYIGTTTTAVTRTADSMSIAVPAGHYQLDVISAAGETQTRAVSPGTFSLVSGVPFRISAVAMFESLRAAQIYDLSGTSLPGGLAGSGGAGGTLVNSSGNVATGSAPRIDYGGAATPAVLVEPAATNLVRQSNALNTTPWALTGAGSYAAPTYTANQAVSPDGTTNAAKLDFPAGSTLASNSASNVQQQITGLTAGRIYVVSFWAKGATAGLQLPVGVQQGGAPYAYLALKNFTFTASWSRYSMVFTADSSAMYLVFGSNYTIPQGTGDMAAVSLNLYGVQVEAGYTPSSYIPTTTTAVTRTADAVTATVTAADNQAVLTFDDGSSQALALSAGSAAVPVSLVRRPRLRSLGLVEPRSKPITSLTLGTPWKYSSGYPAKYCRGDTWHNTWADDDVIYTAAGDIIGGWSNSGSTMMFCPVSTLSTFDQTMTGTLLNSMRMLGQTGDVGSDGSGYTYKPNGMISIGGVLYLAVARNNYGTSGSGWIQTCSFGQILKSTDHGVTWSPTTPGNNQPYASPQFTDAKFRTPAFVMYGKDYQGNTAHNSDAYVYAISNGATWNNGDALTLGRCLISDMASLDGSKWSYYQGGDGMQASAWGSISTAKQLLAGPRRFGQVSVQYLPFCGRYLMLSWFYPQIRFANDNTPAQTLISSSCSWEVYEAPTPWGPWGLVQTADYPTRGLYGPVVIQKSLSTDGGKTIQLITCGDFNSQDPATGEYQLTLVSCTVNV